MIGCGFGPKHYCTREVVTSPSQKDLEGDNVHLSGVVGQQIGVHKEHHFCATLSER